MLQLSDSKQVNNDWRQQASWSENYYQCRQKFPQVMKPFSAMWDGHLKRIRMANFCIALTSGVPPVYAAPHQAGTNACDFQSVEMEKMIERENIEPATTEWVALIVLGAKKDGPVFCCVEYRKLNTVTQRDSQTIPERDHCSDSMGKSTKSFTLGANSGYWQAEMDRKDKNETAFKSHSDLHRFTQIPLGLKMAPGTVERAMNVILAMVEWQSALVYLDDLVIFSETPDE